MPKIKPFDMKLLDLLCPQAGIRRQVAQPQEKTTRKSREVKVYKKPHNGEVVQAKGGNHAVLKAWKAERGSVTVESWRQLASLLDAANAR